MVSASTLWTSPWTFSPRHAATQAHAPAIFMRQPPLCLVTVFMTPMSGICRRESLPRYGGSATTKARWLGGSRIEAVVNPSLSPYTNNVLKAVVSASGHSRLFGHVCAMSAPPLTAGHRCSLGTSLDGAIGTSITSSTSTGRSSSVFRVRCAGLRPSAYRGGNGAASVLAWERQLAQCLSVQRQQHVINHIVGRHGDVLTCGEPDDRPAPVVEF